MAKDLPYLASYKNVEELFSRIRDARQPDSFSQRFLADSLGLKSAGDRALIALLKALGFLDAGSRPTKDYPLLKNPKEAGPAIASAIQRAYKPLFDANEACHKLSPEALRGLVAQVAGTDQGMTSKIVGTFNALIRVADFEVRKDPSATEGDSEPDGRAPEAKAHDADLPPSRLRPEFHYNIQIHLPSNGTEETYLSIFNAVRRAFS